MFQTLRIPEREGAFLMHTKLRQIRPQIVKVEVEGIYRESLE